MKVKDRSENRRIVWVVAAVMAVAILGHGASAHAECSPTDRQTADQNYSTALQFVSQKQWTEAVPSLEAGLTACPEHWQSVELMAQAKMRTKDFPSSIDWFGKLINGQYDGLLVQASPRVLEPYGYALLQNRNWALAESVYEAILSQDPTNVKAHERLVYAYDKSGDTAQTIEHLEALHGLVPEAEKAEVANRVGLAYKKAGDTETATQWFEMSGEAGSGLFDVGVGHMNRKEWQKGANAFQSYVQDKPTNVSAWKNLGLCLQQLGKDQEALTALEKAHELAPSRADVTSHLGILYSDVGQWSKAGQLAQSAVQGWDENERYKGSMYYLMGKVYEKRDSNYEAAIDMFQKAKAAKDPYWAEQATREIGRQRQLIEIRDQKGGR